MNRSICPLLCSDENILPFDNLTRNFISFCGSKNDDSCYSVNNLLSTVEFDIYIGKKIYTIKANFYVSTILYLLINRSMTFKELVQRLSVSEDYAGKLIIQLHKLKFIKRTGKGAKFNDDDVLSFNTNFSNTKNIILIPVLYTSTIEKYIKAMKNEAIDCKALRILKQRMTVEKNELIHLVIEGLNNKFAVTPDQVLKMIERLNGQYLSREVIDGKETYKYIG